ncbi:MAG: proton-conducting transporter membrane subunit, partial [candidate division Zixibacteria bacterium]|nr:proton-conducting transporter membrane subunit [candidate division Zixibacteria bacterium]
GLRHRLPTTYFTFLIATLAISGIPGLSGFFSKDEILWKSFSSTYGSPWIWMIGILTAALTAFYMFRLLYLIFFGAERMDTVTKEHLHESPRIMTVPLVVLATLAIIGGYIGFPRVLGGGNWFEKFLEPATKEMPVDSIARSAFMAGIDKSTVELILMIGSIAAVLGAIYLAYYFYIKNAAAAGQLRNWLRPLHKLIYGKYYIDELYDAAIVRPLLGLSLFLWKIVDVIFIDGLINGVAVFIGQLSKGLRALQSGRLRTYATIFLAGVAVIIGYYLFQ